MHNVMSREVFREEVEKRLIELPLKARFYFAWLCAVRALPFISINQKFNCWRNNEIQTHLQSIFYAIDITANGTSYSRANASAAAASATAAATTNSAAANATAFTAAFAANAAFAFAADAANTACETALADHIDSLKFEFQAVILNDIEAIQNNSLNGLQNDTSIYEELWERLQGDLTAIGCGYWAKLYADIFENRFQLDGKFLESLERRINVPSEVREQGAAAVAKYLENAEKQGLVYTRRETRLIILGSAGAGKTTLARRLNGDSSFPYPSDSTHGVDTSVVLDCNGIKTHVWDFGGQVIYHASHRCFMSANCVYILVVNARTENNRDISRIKYWLDTIRVYSDNNASVFIILNESDIREHNIGDYESLMHGEYAPLIQNIFSFNIGEDMTGVKQFKKELTTYIETIGHQAFGQNDSRAIWEIKVLFDQNKKILNTDELESILKSNGIRAKKDQSRAKELLNTLGMALSYDFMENYVLDPYWISHGVYKVIDHLQKTNSKFITYNDLDVVFADERSTYPKQQSAYILDLMAHYKIGFRNKGGVHGLIVPCVASQFKPKDVIVDVGHNNIVTQVEREDLQEFPADFFYRYICANEDDIKKNEEIWAMWQTGMVLAGECASALVELIENRRIEITVWGERKNEYSKKLELLINDLLKEYHFTSYEGDRKKSGKIVKFITLVFESVAKGVAKALLETASGGIVKPAIEDTSKKCKEKQDDVQ